MHLLIALVALTQSVSTTDALFQQPGQIQAVIETTAGSFVMEFYPDAAPNHVRQFLDRAATGSYTNTTFHSMVPNGIVQGGDPLTREIERTGEYGTGGFNLNLESEFNDIEFVAGTVAATLQPGNTESGGAQFFICISDQPQFSGQFTAFAHVVEGLDVLARISAIPTDENQIALERIEITEITFRPVPPPPAVPFSLESIGELAEMAVVIDTSLGEIVLGMLPELAPNHVRHFLRLVSLEVYDQTAVHRVAPGFVIQTGDLNTRSEPYPIAAREYVVPIAAELNDRNHTRGIVSLARGDDPDSGLTSFFIVLDDQPALDGVYTVFAEVVSGLEVIDRIAAVETDGETPLERIDVYAMRVQPRN